MTVQTKTSVLRIANHWKGIAAAFVLTVFFGACLFWMIESYSFVKCLHWAVYNVTSTGLGIYPETHMVSILLSIFLEIWGVLFLGAMITAYVVNALRVDPDAFTDAEQKEILNYIRRKEAEDRERESVN